jgi:hypothetical protein
LDITKSLETIDEVAMALRLSRKVKMYEELHYCQWYTQQSQDIITYDVALYKEHLHVPESDIWF